MNHIQINQNDLIQILCDEANWESHGIHPRKGLLLYGMTGVGKTYALNAYLKETLKNMGHQIDAEVIEIGVAQHGANYFGRFLQDNMVWNDFGQEERVMMYMGTTIKPGQSIFMYRHTKFPTLLTHFTTNRTLDGLEERYGDRIFSRLAEMCTFINVTGVDRRKNP